jgi:hypothetical protein
LDVIEHLGKAEVLHLLSLVRETLDANGIVLVKTVNAANVLGGYVRYMDLTHEVAFTEESIREALTAVGFSRVTWIQYKPWNWRQRLRRRAKRLLYWGLYRVLEARKLPHNVDTDIIAVASK